MNKKYEIVETANQRLWARAITYKQALEIKATLEQRFEFRQFKIETKGK